MHPNEKLIRDGYEAFAKGDMETIDGMFCDDVVWNMPGRSPLAGTYRGKNEVFEFFGKTMDVTDGTFKTEVVDVCGNDERVFCCTKDVATVEGETLEEEVCAIYTFRDGKVASARFFSENQYETDRFFSKGTEVGDFITQEQKQTEKT